MAAGRDYNSILNELKEDFGEGNEDVERFVSMLDTMPAQAYTAIWQEYSDPYNMHSVCFVIEAMSKVFIKTGLEN